MTDTTAGAPGVGAFPVGFTGFLSGFSANLYIQPNPASGALVPLTSTQLGAKDLQSPIISDASVTAIILPANNLLPQTIGSIGPGGSQEISLSLQGARYSNKLPIQSQPSSVALTVTYDVGNIPLQLLSSDGNLGTVTRTAVVVSTLFAGATTYNWVYAFNFRATPINWVIGPDNAHLGNTTLVPIGGLQFGYSYTTSP